MKQKKIFWKLYIPKQLEKSWELQKDLTCSAYKWNKCTYIECASEETVKSSVLCFGCWRSFMNEWMNEWCIYIVLFVYCCTPKALYNHVGGGLSSTATSVQHPLGWCDGCHRTTAPVRSPHTSYRWRGERVIEPIKFMVQCTANSKV